MQNNINRKFKSRKITSFIRSRLVDRLEEVRPQVTVYSRVPPLQSVLFSRYNLTELKNIDKIVNDKKLFIKYLENKIRTNIVTTKNKTSRVSIAVKRNNLSRIFIVGIYCSTFLQKLVIKFLNKTSPHKLFNN
jgi:hypothetical protein